MPTLEELLEKLPELIKQKDTILVKASHFMKFDQVVEKLVSKIENCEICN